jgi:hypothetical protein
LAGSRRQRGGSGGRSACALHEDGLMAWWVGRPELLWRVEKKLFFSVLDENNTKIAQICTELDEIDGEKMGK